MGARKMKVAKYESGTSTMAFSVRRGSAIKVAIKVLLCALAVVSFLGVLVAVLGA